MVFCREHFNPFRMRHVGTLFCLLVLFFAFPIPSHCCTSVIITGKITPDGRPLMWKNTDGSVFAQRLSFVNGEKYDWIGLALEENPVNAWFGTNSAGFCIMNTMSYNFVDNESWDINNGFIMKMALDKCASLRDFLHLLDTIAKPIPVSSNYGVIDTLGNAVYVETYPTGYHVVDVNDPAIAPEGFLVYTNYSRHGERDAGMGYIRYYAAVQILRDAIAGGEALTPHFIFDKMSRSFYQPLLGLDLRKMADEGYDLPGGFFPDSDFIPRRLSAVASVIQAVRPGENPQLTTLWTALGYPPCSVAVPAWVSCGKEGLPMVLRQIKGDENHDSPICRKACALKSEIFPVTRGNGKNYFRFSGLYNSRGTGIIQRLAPVEAHIRDITLPLLAKWRSDGHISDKERDRLCREIDAFLMENFINRDFIVDKGGVY